ncbi:unnamed protein product [Coregonus sp. 'balchen']|nr:unnamed protein product [Coregonus sp. 'balchen']
MNDHDTITECSNDVFVHFAESLHIFTGLLTVATVCGVFSGIIAAALLYVFCLKPMLLTRQGYDARRLFEGDDQDRENNQSDCVSNSKKGVQSATTNEKEKKQPPVNSDVAAFASRAKVVYPINQKYRPLADGASNPSLHEHSKLPVLPNGESSSGSSGDSLSQDQDNDDSSQYISSSLVPKSMQNESFTRVALYPHTLSQTGFEGRISLYCLALQDVQIHCSQVLEEKCVLFLQILRIILSGRFPKDKKDSGFYTNVLLLQEKELGLLKKELSASLFACERNKDLSSDPCTLEEIERTQKDLLEQALQMTKGFSKQVEAFCQSLLGRSSVLPREEAQDVIHTLIHCLLLVENQLTETQAADMKRTQEKLLWWEELRVVLQAKPALLRQEASLRQDLVARSLEQLTKCRLKTKELVYEKCKKIDSKKKKLLRTHAKERSRVLDSAQTHSDLQEFVKVYQELLLKQRKQSSDLELQQDGRVAEAVCDLWRRHHATWSKKLGELAKDIFLSALPAQPQLSTDQGQRLWLDLDGDLVALLQQAESNTKRQLEGVHAQLEQDGQRHFVARHFCLRVLKEMRLSKLKVLSQSDFRALLSLEDHTQTTVRPMLPKAQHQESSASVAERHLGPETQLIGHSFQQEFLSELETGAELLQANAQQLVGHALSQSLWQQMDQAPPARPQPDRGRKSQLTEVASESVYVTRDSLSALVTSYYSQIQDITKGLQQQHPNRAKEECERRESSSQMNKALLKELANWGRKPMSTEFHQRVELQKKRMLEQYELEQEVACETLRRRKLAQEQTMERIKGQLQEAEEAFIAKLSALARIPLSCKELNTEDDIIGEESPTLNPTLWKRRERRERETLLTNPTLLFS